MAAVSGIDHDAADLQAQSASQRLLAVASQFRESEAGPFLPLDRALIFSSGCDFFHVEEAGSCCTVSEVSAQSPSADSILRSLAVFRARNRIRRARQRSCDSLAEAIADFLRGRRTRPDGGAESSCIGSAFRFADLPSPRSRTRILRRTSQPHFGEWFAAVSFAGFSILPAEYRWSGPAAGQWRARPSPQRRRCRTHPRPAGKDRAAERRNSPLT